MVPLNSMTPYAATEPLRKFRFLNLAMSDFNCLMPKGPGRTLWLLSCCFCLDKPLHIARHNSYMYDCALLALPLING